MRQPPKDPVPPQAASHFPSLRDAEQARGRETDVLPNVPGKKARIKHTKLLSQGAGAAAPTGEPVHLLPVLRT